MGWYLGERSGTPFLGGVQFECPTKKLAFRPEDGERRVDEYPLVYGGAGREYICLQPFQKKRLRGSIAQFVMDSPNPTVPLLHRAKRDLRITFRHFPLTHLTFL
jgi:hypothetical protein